MAPEVYINIMDRLGPFMWPIARVSLEMNEITHVGEPASGHSSRDIHEGSYLYDSSRYTSTSGCSYLNLQSKGFRNPQKK